MIEPFAEGQIRKGCVSFGVGSYGYDFRLGSVYRIYCGGPGDLLDPKSPDESLFEELEGEYCDIPPRSMALGQSLEYFRIPRSILTICTGKSTYARCGLVVNVTPFEPEWEGFATLSLSNTAPSPVRVYSGEGIGQLVFLESDEDCQTSYKDKKGKYQAQEGIVHSKIE